jgi:hypothetical protein
MEEKKSYRLDWKQFKANVDDWRVYHANDPRMKFYTSLDTPSNIYVVHKTYDELHLNIAKQPFAVKYGLKKAIENLAIHVGMPAMAVDTNAANKLFSKRKSLRGRANKWYDVKVIYDEHGAIVLPNELLQFDIEHATKLYKEYLETKDKEEADETDRERNDESAGSERLVRTSSESEE